MDKRQKKQRKEGAQSFSSTRVKNEVADGVFAECSEGMAAGYRNRTSDCQMEKES
jgi:hypothetical protein